MRETIGGFEDRFRVTRTDGEPVRPEARYFVLDYAGDIHAREALVAYIWSVKADNPQLAADLSAALEKPEDWPSQHG